MQGQRAALVDAVVEHEVGAGVGEQQVLRERAEHRVVRGGALPDGRTAGCLRPDPLRVAGESLVQPDVSPVREPDAVAEPLMRELVRDQSLFRTIEVIRAEGCHPLRLERDLERVGRHDDVVARERIGPERTLEDPHHVRQIAKAVATGAARARG